MPISISFADGEVTPGEDKRFGFTPKDGSGSTISVAMQSVTLTLTDPDGGTVEKQKADFSQSGDERFVFLPFEQAGRHDLVLEVTGPQGNREDISDTVSVKPN